MKTQADTLDKLELELKELQGWANSLANEVKIIIPQVRRSVSAEKMMIETCPSRGAMASLCLSGIAQRIDEVQAALGRTNALVLDGEAPWNNRGDEKGSWKR